ncbi:MAG: nucleotidyltransferase family protein [Gammaproteobacteria bacterium]
MKSWKDVTVGLDTTIRETIERIDASSAQIALVCDAGNHLLGTVTDGDVRRGILRGVRLETPVREIMNTRPTKAGPNDDRGIILEIMKKKLLRQIPIVDGANCVLGLETLDELLRPEQRDSVVVIMAGGLGMRLRPLTEECPKPMLPIGGRPILETILCNFVEYNFRRFYISVNYMAERISEYFGDGSKWGAEIHYIHEDRKLGTAGALSLLPIRPNDPFIVMNGDVLTKVNFDHLLDFHSGHAAQGTMCVREYDFEVPYGVVNIQDNRISDIDEKPVHRFFVNAGIYVLEPSVLDHIEPQTHLDMPDLFKKLMRAGRETAAFPIREYWMDIGRHADLERANGEYEDIFL